MSRTSKDRPSRVRFPEEGNYDIEKPKKPKNVDTKWHWLQNTPSWWTNLFMERPLRHAARRWERDVQKITSLDDLEDLDKPNVSKKPHVYYY
jgi:hypothetical protein